VLRVPNAALSFRPKDRTTRSGRKAVRGTRIYRLDGDSPRAIAVRTGITTQPHGDRRGDIAAGDQVIVRETVPKKDAAEKTFRFRMM